MQSKEIITAPKADAITSSDVFDSSSVCGALSFNIMKEIKLSCKGIKTERFVALVDDEDYEYLNQWNWSATRVQKTHYAKRNVMHGSKRTSVMMHRLIMNTPDNLQVDHIDHNGLNNQKYNLRNCTHNQNQMNMNTDCNHKGVTHRKHGDKNYYIAKIKYKGKSVYLKASYNIEDCIIAYNKAALTYFGEYAYINKI